MERRTRGEGDRGEEPVVRKTADGGDSGELTSS